MSQLSEQFEAMNDAALERMQEAYFNALAMQQEGLGAEPAWSVFRRLFIRSYILAGLFGQAESVQQAKRAGVEVNTENVPIEPSELAEQYQMEGAIITRPFAEALNEFDSLVPLLRNEVDLLTNDAKARAFWVTDIESKEALVAIKKQLRGRLESNTLGLQGFINLTKDTPAEAIGANRLETIFRTNTSSAFNAGRHKQMTNPRIVDKTALWRLDEIQDRRTRGNPRGLYPEAGPHFQMDGFIAPPNATVWKVIWPPNGFNCRATVTLIPWSIARRMGLATKDNELDLAAIDRRNGVKASLIASGEYPDQGFSGGPIGSQAA